jgi:hypothetical protein
VQMQQSTLRAGCADNVLQQRGTDLLLEHDGCSAGFGAKHVQQCGLHLGVFADVNFPAQRCGLLWAAVLWALGSCKRCVSFCPYVEGVSVVQQGVQLVACRICMISCRGTVVLMRVQQSWVWCVYRLPGRGCCATPSGVTPGYQALYISSGGIVAVGC